MTNHIPHCGPFSIESNIVSAAVHACFGYNLYQEILDMWNAREVYSPVLAAAGQAQQTYTDWDVLVDELNSASSHGFKIFRFTGSHSSSTSRTIRDTSDFIIDGNGVGVLDGQSDAFNGGTLNGAFRLALFENCNNGTVRGLEIMRMRDDGISCGLNDLSEGCDNMLIEHNNIHRCGEAAVRGANQNTNMSVLNNELSFIGKNDNGSGEGVYLGWGSGSGGSRYSNDTVIRGNHMHDLLGEAIDLKKDSVRCIIDGNLIENIEVETQGAITLGLNEHPLNGKVTVTNNRIRGVTARGNDGNGMSVDVADVDIRRNIVWDCANDCIEMYQDIVSPNRTVTVEENILINSPGFKAIEEAGVNLSAFPNVDLGVLVQARNIMMSGATGTNCSVASQNMIGPFTGANANFTPQ